MYYVRHPTFLTFFFTISYLSIILILNRKNTLISLQYLYVSIPVLVLGYFIQNKRLWLCLSRYPGMEAPDRAHQWQIGPQ